MPMSNEVITHTSTSGYAAYSRNLIALPKMSQRWQMRINRYWVVNTI